MERENTMQTTIRVSSRVWRLLRALAEHKALEAGGRPSASAVIAELVDAAAARKGLEPGRRA